MQPYYFSCTWDGWQSEKKKKKKKNCFPLKHIEKCYKYYTDILFSCTGCIGWKWPLQKVKKIMKRYQLYFIVIMFTVQLTKFFFIKSYKYENDTEKIKSNFWKSKKMIYQEEFFFFFGGRPIRRQKEKKRKEKNRAPTKEIIKMYCKNLKSMNWFFTRKHKTTYIAKLA